ncbi:hypothetical protein A0H81_06095, partial [Grifola frondosa]
IGLSLRNLKMSQPSSPMLKARRQSTALSKLYSRILWALSLSCMSIWFIWYMALGNTRLEDLPYDRLVEDPPNDGTPFTATNNNSVLPGAYPTSELKIFLSNVSHPAIRILGDQTSPISSSLSAILPVTSSSLPALALTLRSFLEHTIHLSEVIVLSSQSIQSDVRGIVRSLMTNEDDVRVEFSLRLWSTGTDQSTAMVHVARQVTTEWVLFLDEYGLESVDSPTKELLTFHNLPPFALPTGPLGISGNLSKIACIQSSNVPQHAAFLVPPFLMPSFMIPEMDFPSDSNYGVWSALGKHVVQAGLASYGGEIFTLDDSKVDWCSRYQPVNPTEMFVTSQAFEIPRLLDGQDTAIVTAGAFVLMFSLLQDLRYFLPVACKLQHAGQNVFTFVEESVSEEIPEGQNHALILDNCRLEYIVASSSVGDIISNPEWINHLPLVPDVVISTKHAEKTSVGLDFVQHRYKGLNIPIIRVPPTDLPFCDWMGSLTLQEWRNWHLPQIEISVITNDRPHSLTRLLSSLINARYFGDAPGLRINLEQNSDAETMQIVDGFQWNYGHVFLHHRVIHGGLLPAVVESWYPRSNDSYGLILEDDVEVSPLFYAWIKMSLLHHRYGRLEDRSSQLFGISLYQQKNLELRPEGRHLFNARNTFSAAGMPHPNSPYLSQIPCSWGAVYFPEHWREFHAYLSVRLSESAWTVDQPIVPGVRSNRWTRSWKKYFIELVYLRGYVMLYPNYADYVSLSTNHLEIGSHVKDVPTDAYLRKKRLFLLPLLQLPSGDASSPARTGLLDLPDGALPPWEMLPTLDLLGLLTIEDVLVQRGNLRRAELTGCINVTSAKHDVRDLLCLHDFYGDP